MMPKKVRKTKAAQQLIDSLLDESTPTGDARSIEVSSADAPTAIVKSEESVSLDFSSMEPAGAKPQTKAASKMANAPPSREVRDASEDPTVQLPRKPKADPVLSIDDGRSHPSKGPLPSFGSASTAPNLTGADMPNSFARTAERTAEKTFERSEIDRQGLTEMKTVLKMRDRHPDPRQAARSGGPSAGGFSSSEAALKQSESLRIAQGRITELENEVERLRRENEQLASAGETLRRRADETLTKSEQFELQLRESERIHSEEKKVYRGQLTAKDRELGDLRARLEEMESRLESNFKKIRVRERELEHRLEIVRMESQTLVATKDKMILELKRQIDQLAHENEFAKQKSQEHFAQFKEKQETIRRVVRALRIALTSLEGDEDSGMKKPE